MAVSLVYNEEKNNVVLKQNFRKNSGFTLMELLVVIGIMVLLATVLIINYNRQRGVRNLKIAQNELITNLRKTQSYILSARNSPSTGLPAKFYILRLGTVGAGTPAVNSIYRIQNIDTNYAFGDPEQLLLPQGIVISGITVARGGTFVQAQCAQLMFSSPFGRLYTYYRTSDNNCGSIVVTDGVVQSPSQLLGLVDSTVTITLQDTKSLATRTVVVSGVSGKVEPGP